MTPLLFAICVLALIALAFIRRDRRLDSLPGPPAKYPFIGLGTSLPPKPRKCFREWAQQYGELFTFRLGWYNWVVVNSPEAMKEIFDKQSLYTSSKTPMPVGDGLTLQGMRQFTMPYNKRWRAVRAITHSVLATPQTMTFKPSQEFEAKQLMHDCAFNNTDDMAFYTHVRRLAFSTVMTSTYGRRVPTPDHEDMRIAFESIKLIGQITRPGAFIEDELPFLAHLPFWALPSRKKVLKYREPILQSKLRPWNRLVDEVKRGKAPECFGKAIVNSEYQKQGISDELAAWVTSGLVEAGSETTSVTLNNLILRLAANPAIQEPANEEISRIVGDERCPSFEDMPHLPYVRACTKEIMRIAPLPTFGIKHHTDADITYKGQVIPKNTVLIGNLHAINFDSARYPEPFTFRPERYLGHQKYSTDYVGGDPYERDHFVFGVGRRICPGAKLAENTLFIAAASIMWAFEVRSPLDADGKEIPVDTSDAAFNEMHPFYPPKPFKARFIPRNPKRLEVVREQWAQAQKDGYILRGQTVELNGMVTEK
ncbi:hypothetical protein MMC11_004457 [Xylographa trunciseda]|nr:hypothetical protein [Xylographa trunciseda]